MICWLFGTCLRCPFVCFRMGASVPPSGIKGNGLRRSVPAAREGKSPADVWFAGRKVLWGIPVPSPNGVEEGIIVGKYGISLLIKADPVIGRGRHALFFRGMPKRAP